MPENNKTKDSTKTSADALRRELNVQRVKNILPDGQNQMPSGDSSTRPIYTTLNGSVVPLPTGAALEATLAAMNAKFVTGTDIGDVTINNAAGAAAVNIQDGGNSITVDGTVTANAGTNLNTSALALESGGVLDEIKAIQTDRTQFVKVTDGTDDVTVSPTSKAFNSTFITANTQFIENDHGTVTADFSADTSSTVTQSASFNFHVTGLSVRSATFDPTAELAIQPIPFVVDIRTTSAPSAITFVSYGAIPTNCFFDLKNQNITILAGQNWVTDFRLGGATNGSILVKVYGFLEAV